MSKDSRAGALPLARHGTWNEESQAYQWKKVTQSSDLLT
jgi:hypothetical protein